MKQANKPYTCKTTPLDINIENITLYEELKNEYNLIDDINNDTVKTMSHKFLKTINSYNNNILIKQMINNESSLINEKILNNNNLDSLIMYLGNTLELSKTAQENLKYSTLNKNNLNIGKIKEELKYIQDVFNYAKKELN